MNAVLVSACLLGEAVRHDGGDKRSPSTILQRWLREGRVVPVCPELAGGLPVPRPAAEIEAGAGGPAVLAGHARVLTRDGHDVTPAFVQGAEAALALARERGIRVAVLKENSPSCGSGFSHDGRFVGHKVPRPGVTTARLRAAGIEVFGEADFAAADRRLAALEAGRGG